MVFVEVADFSRVNVHTLRRTADSANKLFGSDFASIGSNVSSASIDGEGVSNCDIPKAHIRDSRKGGTNLCSPGNVDASVPRSSWKMKVAKLAREE